MSPPNIGDYEELELLTFHLPTSKKAVFKVLKKEQSLNNNNSYYYYAFYSSSWDILGMYKRERNDNNNNFNFAHIPYSNFIAIVTSSNKIDFIEFVESNDGKLSFQAIPFSLLNESKDAI